MSVLADIKTKVDSRIAELEPLVQEYEKLLAVREQFDAEPEAKARAASAATAGAKPRSSRRRRNGSRAQQCLDLIRSRPGITTQEVATEIGISDANYLYRVLPRLEKEGQLRREGKGWAVAGDPA